MIGPHAIVFFTLVFAYTGANMLTSGAARNERPLWRMILIPAWMDPKAYD